MANEPKLSRNEKTIVSLLGALGVIALLGGIFLNIYPFNIGLVVGISLWILAGAVKIMHGGRKAIISIMGMVGLIVLLIPIFTDLYEFNYGLFIALVIWILSGVVATYLGIKD